MDGTGGPRSRPCPGRASPIHPGVSCPELGPVPQPLSRRTQESHHPSVTASKCEKSDMLSPELEYLSFLLSSESSSVCAAKSTGWGVGRPGQPCSSAVSLGRDTRPHLPSPFLLRVQGLARALKPSNSGHLWIGHCAKHLMAFSQLLIRMPGKGELLLSHFMGEETEVQTDEVKKKSPSSQPVSVPTVEPRHHGTDMSTESLRLLPPRGRILTADPLPPPLESGLRTIRIRWQKEYSVDSAAWTSKVLQLPLSPSGTLP